MNRRFRLIPVAQAVLTLILATLASSNAAAGLPWYAEDFGYSMSAADTAFVNARATLYTENSYLDLQDADVDGSRVPRLKYLNIPGQPYAYDLEFYQTVTADERAFFHAADPAYAVAYNSAGGTVLHWRLDNRFVPYDELGDYTQSILDYDVYRNGEFLTRVALASPTQDGVTFVDTTADTQEENVYRIRSYFGEAAHDYSFDLTLDPGVPGTPSFWLRQADFLEPDYDRAGVFVLSFSFGYHGPIEPDPALFDLELRDFTENPLIGAPPFQVIDSSASIDTTTATMDFLITVDSGSNALQVIGGFVFSLTYSPPGGPVQRVPAEGLYYRTNLNDRVTEEGYPIYLMNPGCSLYRQEYVNAMDRIITDQGYDGIFGDNGISALPDRINTYRPCDYSASTYGEDMIGFLGEIRQALDGYASPKQLITNGVYPRHLAACAAAGIDFDGIMLDGWSTLPRWTSGLLRALWAVQTFPASHVIIRGNREPELTINRLENLASYLLVCNDPANPQLAATLLGHRGYGSLAYYAEQQLDLGSPVGDPFASHDWNGDTWEEIESGDLDLVWPGGLEGFYSPPYVYRMYEKGCVIVDATVGGSNPSVVPADVVPGLPSTLYRVRIDTNNLRAGGRIWTEPVSSTQPLPTTEEGALVFTFDPVATPDVDDRAQYPLYADPGLESVIAVGASHWNHEPLAIEADATPIGGPAHVPLNDDRTGGDRIAGDGIYSTTPLALAVGDGEHALPLRACGSDGLCFYGELRVQGVRTAVGEVSVAGIREGSYVDTRASDGVNEVLAEILSIGKPSRRYSYLEHRWTFNVTSGGASSFNLTAHRPDNSDGDNFLFAFSTNGTDFVPLLELSNAVDQLTTVAIPPVGGTITIRVVDTDRTAGRNSLDSLSIDQMFILTLDGNSVAPIADFTGLPTSGQAPLQVAFTDLSANNPSSWSWSFGDGQTSLLQNPTHTYTVPGTYTVQLSVANQAGSDVLTKNDCVDVAPPAGGTMRVNDIQVTRHVTGRNQSGLAVIVIADGSGQPVPGATVWATATGPVPGSFSGQTLADGSVSFETDRTKNPVGEWCFEVTDVSHPSLTYDPEANVVTQACESGYVFRRDGEAGFIPSEFRLSPNRPNPFNPATEIRFALPLRSHARLGVYNLKGETIAQLVDRELPAGEYGVTWQARGFASGVYFYRLQTETFQQTRRMLLLK